MHQMLADWCPKPSVLVCQRYLDLMLDLSKPGFQIHSGVSKPGALVYRRYMVKIWTRGFCALLQRAGTHIRVELWFLYVEESEDRYQARTCRMDSHGGWIRNGSYYPPPLARYSFWWQRWDC